MAYKGWQRAGSCLSLLFVCLHFPSLRSSHTGPGCAPQWGMAPLLSAWIPTYLPSFSTQTLLCRPWLKSPDSPPASYPHSTRNGRCPSPS